jgi:hypothetical protein
MDQARLRGACDGRGRGAAAAVLIAVAVFVVVGALVIIAATGGAAG